MRTRILGVCMLVLAVAANAAISRQTLVENEKKMTVLLSSEGFFGGGRGSGILLDEKHILTCAHMVSSADDDFFVYTYPFGGVLHAHVEMLDKQDDLALLVLETSATVRVRPVFQPLTYDSEPITVVGNALGSMKWLVSRGILSGTERQYLVTDASVHHGNSGGPWFNEKGEIIAITNWGLSRHSGEGEESGIAGGLSARRIVQVLKQYEQQRKLSALMAAIGLDKRTKTVYTPLGDVTVRSNTH